MNKDQELTIEEYKKLVDKLNGDLAHMNYYAEKRYLEGMIDGLKFSIRCNGVSGGEVIK